MSEPIRAYLCGAMRFQPEMNFPAFHRAAAQLRALGLTVFNPAEHDEANGFDPTGMTGFEDTPELGSHIRQALAADLEWICRHADVVVCLEGWADSKGARAEVCTAEALSLPVWLLGADGQIRDRLPAGAWQASHEYAGMHTRTVLRGPWEVDR